MNIRNQIRLKREYGNKDILGSLKLYLAVAEKGQQQEEETSGVVKQVFSGILDLKKEERGTGIGIEKGRVENGNGNNGNHNNNQSWSTRPRDKNGRFISSSTSVATTTTPAAIHNNTTAAATTAMTIPTPKS